MKENPQNICQEQGGAPPSRFAVFLRRLRTMWIRPTAQKTGLTTVERPEQDVTNSDLVRAAMDAHLQTSQRRPQAVLDAIPDLILRTHRDGTVFECKAQSGEDQLEAAHSYLGRKLHDVLDQDRAEAVRTAIEHAFETGQPQTLQYSQSRNGEQVVLEARVAAASDDELILIAADVTDRRSAETAAQKSHQDTGLALKELAQHKYALDQHAIVAATDPTGRITYVNDKFCEISGYSRDELLGQDHRLLNSKHHPKRYFKKLWETIRAGQVWHGEICNLTKDDRVYWVDTTITPFSDQDGRITQYVAIRTDVTERRVTQERLTAANARLQAVLDASSEVAIVATGLDGMISTFNRGAERMLGWSQEEVVGRRSALVFLVDEELRARAKELSKTLSRPITGFETLAAVARHAGSEKREWTFVAKDGRRIDCEMVVTPQRGHNEEIIGYLGLALDITERKRAEGELNETNLALTTSLGQLSCLSQELEESRQAAEEAIRVKSEFLANMSHEIRTPMTAILGYTDILRGVDGPVSPEQQREAVRTIQRNGNHLLAILNDILDLSKIEAGRMTLERIACAPALVAADVAAMMRPRADGKALTLDLVLETPVPRTIQSDPTRLRQILVNLVGNAIKFTEQGGVRIVLKVEAGPENQQTMQFIVADTGIGMSELEVARLFKPFTQADASTTRKFGGTGLGLSIGKRLSELLGGDITVHSVEGAGSAFALTLPIQNPELITWQNRMDECTTADVAAPLPDSFLASSKVLAGIRLMLAEDGPDNQRLISFRLRKAGAEVIVVGDGRAAVNAAEEARAAGTPFDLILMDMQMPELDGYGATSELRALGYDKPIVALTAHAMSGDRDRCIRAGCDDYVTKPISRDTLLAVSLRWGAGTTGR